MVNYHSFYTNFHCSLAFYIASYNSPKDTLSSLKGNIDDLINQKLSLTQKKEFFLFIDKISTTAYSILKNAIDNTDLKNLNKLLYQDIYTDDQLLEKLNSLVGSIKKKVFKEFCKQLKNYKPPLEAAILIKKIFNFGIQEHSPLIVDYFKSNLEVFNSVSNDKDDSE